MRRRTIGLQVLDAVERLGAHRGEATQQGELLGPEVPLLPPADNQRAEQALQDEIDVELAVVGVADADGDVLEIDEQRQALFFLRTALQILPPKGGVRYA